jgi:hypothetical protein
MQTAPPTTESALGRTPSGVASPPTDEWPSPPSRARASPDHASQGGSGTDEARSSMTSSNLDSSSAPSVPTTDDICPRTRLQDGIWKQKIYTDSTVRYGCIASTVLEPCNINEALSDANWKMLWMMNLVLS